MSYHTAGDASTILFYQSVRVNTSESAFVNITDNDGNITQLNTTNGLTPWTPTLIYTQNGSDLYPAGCTGANGNIFCTNPFNISATNETVSNDTLVNITSPFTLIQLVLSIITDTCTPPVSGDWVVGDFCEVEDKDSFADELFNLTGRNLVILLNGSLSFKRCNILVANTTYEGNLTLEDTNLSRGVN